MTFLSQGVNHLKFVRKPRVCGLEMYGVVVLNRDFPWDNGVLGTGGSRPGEGGHSYPECYPGLERAKQTLTTHSITAQPISASLQEKYPLFLYNYLFLPEVQQDGNSFCLGCMFEWSGWL